MIRLIAFAAFALAVTTSAQAMPVAPVHEPDGMITQVAYGCGPFRTRVQGVCVARTTVRQHAAIIAGVRDGMEALALGGTTTETRPNRAGEEHGCIQARIFNLPGNFFCRERKCGRSPDCVGRIAGGASRQKLAHQLYPSSTKRTVYIDDEKLIPVWN